MAKLPTRDDLSAAPSARSGRPIATYDVSAVAKGVQQLGRGISAVGEAGIDIVKHQQHVEDYETERKFQEFKWNETLGLDEATRNVEPGQASSFPDTWQAGYKERAKEFLSGIPESQRGKYDVKAFAAERELYLPAATFARTEQRRASLAGIDDFEERFLPKVTSPESFEQFKTDFQGQIDNNPWLSPIEKDIERRKRLPQVEETYVKGLIERGGDLDAIMRDLGGGPELDADANPETRAKPGAAPRPAAQPAAVTPISVRLETGQTDPIKGVSSIAKDSKGSTSYGNFGLNSLPGASAHQFAAEYGEALGLSGEPGTAEFDNSWKEVARADPEGLHQAEIAWWNKNIVPRVTVDLTHAGVADDVATDPRVQAYFADRLVQYGPASIGNHERRVARAFEASGGDAEKFLRAMSEADRENLTRDFPSALRTGVYSAKGHNNRVYGRLNLALAGGVGGPRGEADGAQLPDSRYDGPYRNLTPEQRLRLVGTARVKLKQEAAEVAQEVRTFENLAEQGFAPQPSQINALRARVAGRGDAETRASFAQAEAIVQWQDNARKAKPEELDAFIRTETERLRARGATPFDAKRLAMADKLLNTMRTELKSDPLGWADRIGMVKVQPVDFSTPETAQASLGLRVTQADSVAQHYGLEPKYLRDDEKQKLTAAIEAGGEQTLAATAMVASSAGEHAPAILAEISKNSPTAAIIGGMVVETGMSGAARDAADGLALRKEAGFQTVAPSRTETRKQVAAVLGASLSGMPKTETAMIDAANAIYEVRARKQQLTEFDSGVWQQALREVVGEREIGGKTYGGIVDADPGWRGGRQIIIPPFVAQEDWRQVIEATNAIDLQNAGLGVPVGGDGKLMPMNRVRGAILVQAGDGRYKLSLGDPDLAGEEKWVVRQDAPGEPYEIDLHKLRPILQQRRPDLFIGGGEAPSASSGTMSGFGVGE